MLFGTAGIRGIYGKDITEELAYAIANIFAEGGEGGKIVISRDTRLSGRSLMAAALRGAADKGADAYDLGMLATPTLALATLKHKCNGMQVTASHNPQEYNGLKLFAGGKEISKEEEKHIEAQYAKKGITKKANATGSVLHDYNSIEDHKNMIKKLVDCKAIAGKNLKVVVDCNGAGTTITPYLVRELGCRITSMNCELAGFNRAGEPNAENLKDAIGISKAIGADIAIAHDGDADRCVVIDDKGEMLPFDVQLAMMIDHELEKTANKKVVTTVEASLLVREAIEKAGGETIITPVGSVYVSESLENKNAYFGGEPCGEYVFSSATHGADGILAAAKFLEIIATKGKLSGLRKKYKSYPMLREKFACVNKHDAMEKIKREISLKGTRSEEDGVRIDEEGGWFLIRASGTESFVRLTMEYKDKNKLEQRAAWLRGAIKKCVIPGA